MANLFSKETQKAYIKDTINGSPKCPICQSTDMEWYDMNIDPTGDSVLVSVACNNCKQEFTELYRLQAIMK